MARISLRPRPSLPLWMAKWWTNRTFGKVMDRVLNVLFNTRFGS